MVLSKPKTCANCPLENIGLGFCNLEGKGNRKVLIVGEALGYNEYIDGLPFRPFAESGSVLETAIKRAGFNRDDFILYNVVNCMPPDNKLENTSWEKGATKQCIENHLTKVVERFKPKAILALGNVSLKHLNSWSEMFPNALTELDLALSLENNKKKLNITNLRGYKLDSIFKIPMVSSLHPSFINRTGRIYIGVLIRDLQFAVRLAREEIPNYNFNYLTNPSVEEAKEFYEYCRQNPHLPIAYDIETPYTGIDADEKEVEFQHVDVREIISIQFAIQGRPAIFLQWNKEFISITKDILGLENQKLGWNNFKFDSTNLEYHLGKGSINGLTHDAMWEWHHLNSDFYKDKSLSLQFAANFYVSNLPPWKHLSDIEPEKYGAIDVDTTLQIYNNLKKVLESKRFAPDTKSLYKGYLDDIVKLHPILDKISERGFPIDLGAKVKFKLLIEKEIEITDKDIQDLYPNHLRSITPKEGYARVPSLVDELTKKFKLLRNYSGNEENNGEYLITDDEQISLMEFIEENSRRKDKEGNDRKESGLLLLELGKEKTKKWARREIFKPQSRNQVIRYMQFKKHKVPKKKDKIRGEIDTTSKDELYKLWEKTNDPLYEKIIYKRELDKLLSTYIDGWITDENGRVHTTFEFLPASGQLSSVNPNIQNCFSGDTELLTNEGWKRFDSLSKTELVAQYDTKSRAIDFVAPLKWIDGFSEDILEINNQHINLKVTAEHECLLQQRRTNRILKLPAKNYKPDYIQLQAGFYTGGDIHYEKWQLILLAAFQADGAFYRGQKYINFYFKKHRKINRFETALIKGNLQYTKTDKAEGKSFYVPFRIGLEWLFSRPVFGNWLLELDKESFNLMAREVMFWDGCWSRKSMYSSSHKPNADWVQILVSLTNKRARLRSYDNGNPRAKLNWQVDVSYNPYSYTTFRTITKLKYNENVYCVTMPKGTVIVRRKNNVCITGNSPERGSRFSSKGYKGLAKQFRKMIAAKSGHVLLEVDYTGFHAICLGFEAEDEKYIKISKVDTHSFIAAHMIRNEFNEKLSVRKIRPSRKDVESFNKMEETLEFIKDLDVWLELPEDKLLKKLIFIKKNYEFIRNSQAKPAVHGMGYGEGAKKLYMLNSHSFKNVAQAQSIIDLMRRLFPKLFEFQDRIRVLADKQTYLISRYGYIRRFFDVFDYRPLHRAPFAHEHTFLGRDKRWWIRKPGMQSEECIAFLPANDAFGKIKEAMRELEDLGMNEKYRLINNVHDSLMFECPKEFVGEASENIKRIMEMPAKYLINSTSPNGLICNVEVKAGLNWAEMRRIL